MKTIKVKGCESCLLYDKEYVWCNLKEDFIRDTCKVPKDCPLKKEPIKIELDNDKSI